MSELNFERVAGNKKEFLELLLLADPFEEMIDKYLEASEMYVLKQDNEIIGEIVIDPNGEIKNLAIEPKYQSRGFGRKILELTGKQLKNKHNSLFLGTSIQGVQFYEKCGFIIDRIIPNFFVDNYDEPIYDSGIQCVDMFILKKNL